MTTIEALSELSMLNIFDRLPLTDLLPAGRACSLFYKSRRNSCRTRHRLILFINPHLLTQDHKRILLNPIGIEIPRLDVLENDDGSRMFPDSPRQNPFHTYQITGSLSKEFVDFVAELFPEIYELEVYFEGDSIKNMDPLIDMLERCASKVTLLRIHLGYESGKFDRFLVKNILPHVRLLSVINSMPSLRRLDFDATVSLVKNRYARIILPVLAQLEQFIFQSSNVCEPLLNSIKRYAVPNGGLTKIQLKTFVTDPAELLQFEPDFAVRFSEIYLATHGWLPEDQQLSILFERFHKLTSLTLLLISPIDRDSLYRALRPLTQLIYIHFNVNDDMTDYAFDPLEGDNDVLVNDNGGQTRLPSVKVITYIIHGEIESHRIFASFRLGHIFPNLQVVDLKFDSTLCQECQRNNIDPSEVDAECLQPMLHTLEEDLFKLKMIITNDIEYFI